MEKFSAYRDKGKPKLSLANVWTVGTSKIEHPTVLIMVVDM